MSQEGFDLLKKTCINNGLCMECGACASVCPKQAIEMKRYPWGMNPEITGSCTDRECRLCYQACAGAEVPISQIEKKFFGRTRKNGGVEKDVGVFRNVYYGYALEPDVREPAVSGGIASGILLYALEKGIIDGAILAHFDTENPWVAKSYVATTPDEIKMCAGSKYQPHPQLLGLREACSRGLKKFAVTATPCHASSVRKIMLTPELSEIGSRVKFIMSNICACHWSLHGTEFLIKEKLKVRLEDVAKLTYRAKPFPGMFKVECKDGSTASHWFVCDNDGLLKYLPQFTPEECRFCLEKIGFSADIVVGDTWHHPKYSPGILMGENADLKDPVIAEGRKGMTMAVSRSELGDSLIREAAAAGYISATPDKDGEKFLQNVHNEGKPIFNGPVIEARKRRDLPLRKYI